MLCEHRFLLPPLASWQAPAGYGHSQLCPPGQRRLGSYSKQPQQWPQVACLVMLAIVDSPAVLEVDQLAQVLTVEEPNRPHYSRPRDSVLKAETMVRKGSYPWPHDLLRALTVAICPRLSDRSSKRVHEAHTLVMGSQLDSDQKFRCPKPCCWLADPTDSWAAGDGLLWCWARETVVPKPWYWVCRVGLHCRLGEHLSIILRAENRELDERRL